MLCDIPASFSWNKSKPEVGTGSEQRASRCLSLDAPTPNALGEGAQSRSSGHKGAGPRAGQGGRAVAWMAAGQVGEDAVVP